MLARFKQRSSKSVEEITSKWGFCRIKQSSLTSRTLAKRIVEFAEDKKATDIVILDMRKVANFCDYFVICSGNSDTQVRAIAEGIKEGVEKLNLPAPYSEGFRQARWGLLDFGDVVVHIFEKETREFYALEYLWQDAVKVK